MTSGIPKDPRLRIDALAELSEIASQGAIRARANVGKPASNT
jgi:hypothetical protein